MRSLGIRARLPRGVYLAHRDDGSPDWFPDPARLHAALLNAAGQGESAVVVDGKLEPSEKSLEALRWLEHNPPAGIEFPEQRWTAPQSAKFIYREVSSINAKRRTEERAISDGVSVNGSYGYRWDNVPEDIASTLEMLCEDVAYLGESSSVAILEPGHVDPTFELDNNSSPFTSGGKFVRIPNPGRTNHLIESFSGRHPAKLPTVARDKFSKSEQPNPPEVAKNFLVQRRYRKPDQEIARHPWTHVILLEIPGADVLKELRVALCVALHRALISALDRGAPPLVTGKYPKNFQRPANRVAFQYLTSHQVAEFVNPEFGLNSGVIAVMLPYGADEHELDDLARAIPAVNYLWDRDLGRRRIRFSGNVALAQEFWKPVPSGFKRLWQSASPIVPETRPVSHKLIGRPWTFEDSGLLSVGFVWKDDFDDSLKGEKLYVALRDQVADKGVRVISTSPVAGKSSKYVHRTHRDVVVQPWSGLIDLGDLSDSSSMVAIGQSRHLGGGLLIPVDIPEEDISGE